MFVHYVICVPNTFKWEAWPSSQKHDQKHCFWKFYFFFPASGKVPLCMSEVSQQKSLLRISGNIWKSLNCRLIHRKESPEKTLITFFFVFKMHFASVCYTYDHDCYRITALIMVLFVVKQLFAAFPFPPEKEKLKFIWLIDWSYIAPECFP